MDQSESAFFIDQSEILKTLLSLDIFSIQMVFQLNFYLYLEPIFEFYFQIFRRSILFRFYLFPGPYFFAVPDVNWTPEAMAKFVPSMTEYKSYGFQAFPKFATLNAATVARKSNLQL